MCALPVGLAPSPPKRSPPCRERHLGKVPEKTQSRSPPPFTAQHRSGPVECGPTPATHGGAEATHSRAREGWRSRSDDAVRPPPLDRRTHIALAARTARVLRVPGSSRLRSEAAAHAQPPRQGPRTAPAAEDA